MRNKFLSILLCLLFFLLTFNIASYAYTTPTIYDQNTQGTYTLGVGSDVTIVGKITDSMDFTSQLNFLALNALGHVSGTSRKIVYVAVSDPVYTTHQYYVYTYRDGYTNSVISDLSTSTSTALTWSTRALTTSSESYFTGQKSNYTYSMRNTVHVRTKLNNTEGYYSIISVTSPAS